jgi:hypothetical protein
MAKKKTTIRGFEREMRIQALIAAELIKEASEIPPDAIPASVAVATRRSGSYSFDGPGRLYYRDRPFQCRDCGAESVWKAQEQRFWFETARGSIYADAKRCGPCREKVRRAHGS